MHNPLNDFSVRAGAWFSTFWTASMNGAALRVISPLQYIMGMACVLIVALALFEPASSAGLNLLPRTLFWSLHLIPATMVAWAISGWLFNTQVSRRVSPWALIVIAGAVTGLLLAPVYAALEILFGVTDATSTGSRPLPFSAEIWLNELGDELHDVPLKCAGLWLLMNAFVVWGSGGMRDYAIGDPPDGIRTFDLPTITPVRPSSMPHDPPPEAISEQDRSDSTPKRTASSSESPGFLARLPKRLGRDIVLLEAQEHYLRIVTSRGEHLLLQGLTHAITELENNGFDGIQIRRSVWVAWTHIENVEVRTGVVSIVVSTGASWKISRRREKAFLAAWRLRHR
ncbi:MAG: LytTR family transcriptional regulator [Aestuariivirga sp.]|uniref:LytTR family DNA-binding domain-containing protein n=1 Tax=Aestuariivirga sp. TaxID=2650926 RepID=UPI0025C3663E|nr:LytTR family DNA-binding domain-containing protein [Aestuariivirga sp.]MCA3559789.1 LytTR family transcriptional regulator [Aestuariivirga sp.]